MEPFDQDGAPGDSRRLSLPLLLIPALVVALIAAAVILPVLSDGNRANRASVAEQDAPGDSAIAAAFRNRQSGIQVVGQGTVTRILADDTNGGRHQRFIIELASGQTLLIAHNIDIAPRVPALTEGVPVSFSGVYEWNDEGGVVHWTHHDPAGVHAPGWLDYDGLRYQ